MVLLINSIAHLVEVPGRLYEFEPGRRELKSPRREIGRDTIVGSAAGVVSISVLCVLTVRDFTDSNCSTNHPLK